MFLSYEYIGYIGYDKETNQHKYRYRIIDSEFEGGGGGGEGAVDVAAVVGGEVAFGAAVIDTYEKRNLPVAPNLIRALLYYAKKHGYPISYLIRRNKQYNPKFAKYEQDINKYLPLI